MVFSRQIDWSGLPFPSPGDLLGLNPGLLHYRWVLYPLATREAQGTLQRHLIVLYLSFSSQYNRNNETYLVFPFSLHEGYRELWMKGCKCVVIWDCQAALDKCPFGGAVAILKNSQLHYDLLNSHHGRHILIALKAVKQWGRICYF